MVRRPNVALRLPRGHNSARIRNGSGRRVSGRHKQSTDRPNGRSSDRPIDFIQYPTLDLVLTGSNVACRLLRQPRGHIEARVQEACGRRVSRRHTRSTDRPNDRYYDGRFGELFSSVCYSRLSPTEEAPTEFTRGRLRVTGRRARSTDRATDRSTDRPIERSTDRFDSIPHLGPGSQQALMGPTGYHAILGATSKLDLVLNRP